MAYALQPHHSYQARVALSDIEKHCTTAIFSDSYLSNPRLHSDWIREDADGRKKISLGPHMIVPDNNPEQFQHLSFIDNYSFGAAKMTTTCTTDRIVHQWATHMPRLTICHLGACDLANGPVGRVERPIMARSAMQNHTHKFFRDLKEAGRRLAGQDRFNSALQDHQFLLIGIPQWGEFEHVRRESLDWEHLKDVRRFANDGLRRAMSSLWQQHRALLFTPNMSWPTFNRRPDGTQDVHLDPATQRKYNDQIFAMAAKMLCSFCKLDPENYDRRSHEAFKESVAVCDRMQNPA